MFMPVSHSTLDLYCVKCAPKIWSSTTAYGRVLHKNWQFYRASAQLAMQSLY